MHSKDLIQAYKKIRRDLINRASDINSDASAAEMEALSHLSDCIIPQEIRHLEENPSDEEPA